MMNATHKAWFCTKPGSVWSVFIRKKKLLIDVPFNQRQDCYNLERNIHINVVLANRKPHSWAYILIIYDSIPIY